MTSILTHVPAGPTPEAKAQIVWCKITEAHCQVDIRISTEDDRVEAMRYHCLVSINRQVNIMANSLVLCGYSMRSASPESTFLLADRLRLSKLSNVYSTLLSQCKYFQATVGYGRKRIVYLYMEGSEAGWTWARNAYQYHQAWTPKSTPTNAPACLHRNFVTLLLK